MNIIVSYPSLQCKVSRFIRTKKRDNGNAHIEVFVGNQWDIGEFLSFREKIMTTFSRSRFRHRCIHSRHGMPFIHHHRLTSDSSFVNLSLSLCQRHPSAVKLVLVHRHTYLFWSLRPHLSASMDISSCSMPSGGTCFTEQWSVGSFSLSPLTHFENSPIARHCLCRSMRISHNESFMSLKWFVRTVALDRQKKHREKKIRAKHANWD